MPLKILPKKRWHVWNQDNVERVLRDERLHAEEQEAKVKQQAAAEHEARLETLKARLGLLRAPALARPALMRLCTPAEIEVPMLLQLFLC